MINYMSFFCEMIVLLQHICPQLLQQPALPLLAGAELSSKGSSD